jgi:RsmE family RNA methyltransferase
MKIDAETPLASFLQESFELRLVGDPDASKTLIQEMAHHQVQRLAFLVGPEGGLTESERAAGGSGVRLAPTILRVETAAVAFMATLAQCGPREAGGG